MENVDWRHLTTGSSGLTGQARSQLNRMLNDSFPKSSTAALGRLLPADGRNAKGCNQPSAATGAE